MWVIAKDYDKYEVNQNGEIRNKRTKRILKPETCKGGYQRVKLYRDTRNSRHELVHRVIASTFLDNTPNYPEVNHKDNNPKNNRVTNLEWCTSQYNSMYSKGKSVIMFCSGSRQHSKTFASVTDAYLETGIYC